MQDEHAKSLVEHRRLGQRAARPGNGRRIARRPWTAASRRAAGTTSRSRTIGNRIRCYLDGKLIHDVRRGSLDSMYAVASRGEKSGDVILKVVNAADTPQDVRISLAGLKGKVKSGTVTVLASADPMDENSLDNPSKVVPRGIAAGGCRRQTSFTASPAIP